MFKKNIHFIASPSALRPQTESIRKCAEFGEIIVFSLGVIAILVKVDVPTLHVLSSHRGCESKFLLFYIIIDNQTPENLSALVWFQSGEKPWSSQQK